jgi:Flp pilus assembly protein TadB
MRTFVLAAGVFLLTVSETVVSTLEGREDRLSTSSRGNKHSLKAAHWATVFEILLLIDVLALVHNPMQMFFPIVAGAWLGKYWAVEKRRKKFRSRVKKKKLTTPNTME